MVNWKMYWQKKGYDKEYIKTNLSIAKDIEKIIIKNRYKTILDFGCGPAIIIKTLAKKYPDKRFIGYDISYHIIKQNRQIKLKNLQFKVMRLNKIPIKEKFDLVLCFSTLHYFKEPLKKIKNLLKIVNKNGSLIVNYPNKQLLNTYYKKGKKLVYFKKRFKLMFQEKNLVTFKQIKKLGYKCKVIREKQPGNKYIQIIKS